MTTVNTVGTSTTGTGTAAKTTATASNTVNYNSFLQLLVQEMKNQDPTSPTDPTAMMGQLASFSQVEQQVNTNGKLDTLLTNTALTQAESVIGRTVTSSDGTVSGVVSSVALGTGGTATATLAGGSTLALDSTVKVSGS